MKIKNVLIWTSISICAIIVFLNICIAGLDESRLFSAFLNLSYSILAAWFFYLIIEVLPKVNSEKENVHNLKGHFDHLFLNLHTVMEMDRCIWKGKEDDYSDISDSTIPLDLSNGKKYVFRASFFPSSVSFYISLRLLSFHTSEVIKEIDKICDLSAFWPIDNDIIDNLIKMKEMPYLNRFVGMSDMNFDGEEDDDELLFHSLIFPLDIKGVYKLTQELHRLTENDSYSDIMLYQVITRDAQG